MANNLDDPKNIAGLSNLLRNDDLESNLDLADLEREIANGAFIKQEEINIANEYRIEMDQLSRNFDIDNKSHNKVKNIYNSPTNSTIHYNSPINNNKLDNNNWDSYEVNDNQLKKMTTEELKQAKINDVLYDIDDKELEFNVERERDDDDKSSLLEQIDMLKITLEDDGVDISGVPVINKVSSLKDIHSVYRLLRLKNDRNRYCSFAEEIILAGAHGVEYLFDGEKEWFNRKPDLSGWSDSVKIKLRRMRFETSTFVQEVMQEYNMSAGVRLALELIPSMFLYSRNRKVSKKDNLVSDNQYKDAISTLNSL